MAYAARPLAPAQVDAFLASVERLEQLPDARQLLDWLVA
jgi:hypothetical protein